MNFAAGKPGWLDLRTGSKTWTVNRADWGVEEPQPGQMHQIKLGAPKAEIVDAGDLIEELRWVKGRDELRIMRRAMYFADFNVQAGRDSCNTMAV